MSSSPRLKRVAALGARFLTVGALSTAIEVATFNLLYLVLGWDVVIAKITASLVALINAYFGNRQWTFRHRGRRRRWVEITLFVVVNAICTLLGALIVWAGVAAASAALGHEAGPLTVNVVNLVSIVVVVVARFAFYHYVVFPARRRRPTRAEPARTARVADAASGY